MLNRIFSQFLIVTVCVALAGCASETKPPSANGGLFRQRNEGYSLLYKLMMDESQVSEIFFLKHANDQIGKLVKDIATACKDAKHTMDDFPKSDNRIEYDVQDLPWMEERSRELEAQTDQKELLGSSGEVFELRLLFTQAQAMSYAVQLCNAILEKEDNPARKTFLESLAQQCQQLHDGAIALLTVKSP